MEFVPDFMQMMHAGRDPQRRLAAIVTRLERVSQAIDVSSARGAGASVRADEADLSAEEHPIVTDFDEVGVMCVFVCVVFLCVFVCVCVLCVCAVSRSLSLSVYACCLSLVLLLSCCAFVCTIPIYYEPRVIFSTF